MCERVFMCVRGRSSHLLPYGERCAARVPSRAPRAGGPRRPGESVVRASIYDLTCVSFLFFLTELWYSDSPFCLFCHGTHHARALPPLPQQSRESLALRLRVHVRVRVLMRQRKAPRHSRGSSRRTGHGTGPGVTHTVTLSPRDRVAAHCSPSLSISHLRLSRSVLSVPATR
jgi:hypothetical protein